MTTQKKAKLGRKPSPEKNLDVSIKVRLKSDEREQWKEMAENGGYKNLSEWIRSLVAAA